PTPLPSSALLLLPPPRPPLFPYTTLFRSSPASNALPRCEARERTPVGRGPSPIGTASSEAIVRLPTWRSLPSSRRSAISCASPRSEEHTSELQSQSNLVCRLLLEKKKKNN